MAAFAMPIIGGLSSILGGIFGNRPSTVTQNVNNTTTSDQNQNQQSSTTPNLTGSQQDVLDAINNSIFNDLKNPTDLSGYAANAMTANNQGAAAQKQLLQQTLAARGLAGQPIEANANAQNDANRIAANSQVQQSLPLLQEQLFQQKLAGAVSGFRANPFGTSTSASGSSSGTQTTNGTTKTTAPGNMLGGLFGGLGNAASMFPSSLFSSSAPFSMSE